MIPKLKVKQKRSKLKVKRRKAKYAWELEKERKKEKAIDWSRYIKVKVPVVPIKYVSFKEDVFGQGGGGRKYGFAKVVKVKKSNRKHTAHLLRLATERQLDPKPAMILSSENYDFETAMEKIKSLHEKKGQQKVAYLEIYCAYESLDLLKAYIKELSEKFNSEVFGVVHTDESVPHCHILVNWCNKQGKALRLKRGDFKRLWATTIQRLQPSRLVPQKKGEGLPRTPYWVYRKAWLEDYYKYAQLCFDQWKQWELFYKWLWDYNWDVEPPFRRRFFRLWLQEEGYEPQPEEIEEVNPFEILKELTSKLKPDKLASSPPGDELQAEGLRNFTTTTLAEVPEVDKVGVGGGGGVDAHQLVVDGEDKKENKVMVVAMEEKVSKDFVSGREEDKEEVMMTTIKEPLEVRTESKVGLATIKDIKEPLEDKKEVVLTTETKDKKEPKRKTEKTDIVLAKKETEDRKEPKEERTEKERENVAITKVCDGWTEDLWNIMKELNKREKEKKKQIKELEKALFRSFDKVKTNKKRVFKRAK